MLRPFARIVHLPKPKRRWAQFSLRGFLLVVTLLCVVVAKWIVPAERQRRAVAAIEAAGGKAEYATSVDSRDVADSAPYLIRCLRHLLPRDYFDDVRYVDFWSTTTDAELRNLEAITGVESVSLTLSRVSDAGMARLLGLKHLRHLYLGRTQISDAGLRYLGQLPELRLLSLNETQVTDAGVAHLQGMTRLKQLYLNHTNVGDESLRHLHD